MRSPKSSGFDEFYAELEAEAQAEGAEAVRDLRAKELKYELINALTTRRRELNLTQENLAVRSGVAQTEISRIERGRKSPTMDTFSRLASALLLELWPTASRGPRALGVSSASRATPMLARRQAVKPAARRVRASKMSRFPAAAKRSVGLSELTRETKRRVKPSRGANVKTRKGKGRTD
jgi:transcriptional regulator with XRE-family HTH domain